MDVNNWLHTAYTIFSFSRYSGGQTKIIYNFLHFWTDYVCCKYVGLVFDPLKNVHQCYVNKNSRDICVILPVLMLVIAF